MTSWVACPECDAPAVLVDEWIADGSPHPTLLAAIECANRHHFAGLDSTRLHRL